MRDSDTLISALTVHLLGMSEQSEHYINTLPCLWDSMLTYNPSLKQPAALGYVSIIFQNSVKLAQTSTRKTELIWPVEFTHIFLI